MRKTVIGGFSFGLIMISAYSLVAIPSANQSKCNLTEANGPNIRGLRLGMSTSQVLALFPGVTKKKEMKEAIDKAKSTSGSETVYLAFDPAADAVKGQFAGVQSVSAGFYKARLVDFSIQYGGPTWRNIDEWIGKLSETLNLPASEAWMAGPSETPNKVLKCDGIEIEAATQGGGASISVRNNAYLKGMEEHTDAAEEKKRREFKPL
jgi:hypothetical protein